MEGLEILERAVQNVTELEVLESAFTEKYDDDRN